MHITLRPGEKIYLNGAVLRVDRKVCLELMNDAVFLLEAHVMSPEKATTPIRQLYFVVQTMLMTPTDIRQAAELFSINLAKMASTYVDAYVLAGLVKTHQLVESARYFEALKLLRGLFGRDDELLGVRALPVAC